jgi:hypothetical protein
MAAAMTVYKGLPFSSALDVNVAGLVVFSLHHPLSSGTLQFMKGSLLVKLTPVVSLLCSLMVVFSFPNYPSEVLVSSTLVPPNQCVNFFSSSSLHHQFACDLATDPLCFGSRCGNACPSLSSIH